VTGAAPRHWWPDLAPLKVSSRYRRLFIYGTVGSVMGQATYVALLLQLKQLTHSVMEVGSLGLVEFLPLLFGGLYGGLLADRFERRLVVMASDAAMFASVVALFVNSRLVHPSVVVVFVTAAVVASQNGIASPSLSALVQELVPHDLQRQVAVLEIVQGTSTSIAGPAVGGLLAATAGVSSVYLINAIIFGVTFALLVGIRSQPGGATVDRAALRVGLRYAAERPDILGSYVVDLWAMTAAYPVLLLPFLATQLGGRYTLALLFIGLPVGSLLFSLTSRWTAKIQRHGRAITVAAALWGVGIAIAGLNGGLVVAFLGLMIAGAADSLSGVFRMAMWNESILPEVRGRMAGIETLSYSLGPTAGQFRAGQVAAATTLRTSLVIGGLSAAGGCAALGPSMRAFWRYDARTSPHVAAVRELRGADGEA
jgi:MFS family permease